MQTRSQSRQPECAVCYQRITFRGQLDPCNHLFCVGCITQWAQKENTCPLCKRRFQEINKVPTRPLYSQQAKRLVQICFDCRGRQKVQKRDQSQTNPFVQFYVNSLENSQFYSNQHDVNFLSFLIALDRQLDNF